MVSGAADLRLGHLVSYADAIQSVEGSRTPMVLFKDRRLRLGKCYSMVLCAGNNHTMIERMLSQTRPWWRVVVTSQNSYSEFCSSEEAKVSPDQPTSVGQVSST